MEAEPQPGIVLSRLQRAYAETTEGQRWTTALTLIVTLIFVMFGLRTESGSQLPELLDAPPLVTQPVVGETRTAATPPPTSVPLASAPPPPPLPVEIGDDGESDENTHNAGGIADDTTPTTTSPSTTEPPPSDDGDDDGDGHEEDDGSGDGGGMPELPLPIP